MNPLDKNIPLNAKFGIPMLPEPYQSVAHKRIIERKDYKIIAEEMNITVNHCYLCVRRAKVKLRKLDAALRHWNGNKEELEKILRHWYRISIEAKA